MANKDWRRGAISIKSTVGQNKICKEINLSSTRLSEVVIKINNIQRKTSTPAKD